MERSFFNPRLPFMHPPGDRWDALFDQYHTSLRNAGLGALGGGTLGALVGYLATRKLGPSMFGAAAGILPGFMGSGHLTYESLRDTIPLTKQEQKEQDPMYRIRRLLKFKGV